MNLESQLLGMLCDRGGRQIRLTQSEYDQAQHELCMGLAQMIWGEKGLVDSLGHVWGFVMDPRFTECEKAWYKKIKITGSATYGKNSEVEYGSVLVGDDGSLTTPRLMTLDQYAEIIGEGRHFIEVVNKRNPHYNATEPYYYFTTYDPALVKDWSDEDIWALIKQECGNYFTQKGEPNQLAKTLFQMFKADWLGLITDYALMSNIDQWVFAETGDVAPRTLRADPDNPIVHAEIEYLDRALTFRTMLRGNTVKVLIKLGGNKLSKDIEGLVLTEFEKDEVLKEVFRYKYDEIYKALPVVLSMFKNAKEVPFDERENLQLGIFRKRSKSQMAKLASGELKPLDLLDGDEESLDEEMQSLAKIQHDENLVTLFYVQIQADELVKAYPKMQNVLDIVKPYLDAANPIPQVEFDSLLDTIQDLTNIAVTDTEVGTHDGI